MQEGNPQDGTSLGGGFDMHTDISKIRIDKKGSAKSKIILGLSLISLWVPFVTAIASLVLIPSARHEINNSDGKLTGLRMLSWGKAIAWITIAMDTLGLLILLGVFLFAGELFHTVCLQGQQEYCELYQYTLHS